MTHTLSRLLLQTRQTKVVKDSQKLLTTSINYLYPQHYRQNGQSWYVCLRFLTLSLDDVHMGVHGMSMFEGDAGGLSCLLYGRSGGRHRGPAIEVLDRL